MTLTAIRPVSGGANGIGRAVAQQTDKQRELGDKHAELSKAADQAGRTVVDARAKPAAPPAK